MPDLISRATAVLVPAGPASFALGEIGHDHDRPARMEIVTGAVAVMPSRLGARWNAAVSGEW